MCKTEAMNKCDILVIGSGAAGRQIAAVAHRRGASAGVSWPKTLLPPGRRISASAYPQLWRGATPPAAKPERRWSGCAIGDCGTFVVSAPLAQPAGGLKSPKRTWSPRRYLPNRKTPPVTPVPTQPTSPGPPERLSGESIVHSLEA